MTIDEMLKLYIERVSLDIEAGRADARAAEARHNAMIAEIRADARAAEERHTAQMVQLNTQIDGIRKEITDVRKEVTDVRKEVTDVRAEVAEVRNDFVTQNLDAAARQKEDRRFILTTFISVVAAAATLMGFIMNAILK